MFLVKSVYEGYKNRLQERDFGTRVWAYVCIGVFLAAMAFSMLGCYAPTSPRAEGTLIGGAAGVGGGALIGSAEGAPGTGAVIGGLLGAGTGYLVGNEIENREMRGYYGYYPGYY